MLRVFLRIYSSGTRGHFREKAAGARKRFQRALFRVVSRRNAQDRRDEVGVEFEAAEESPNDPALKELGANQPQAHQPDKDRDSKEGNVVSGAVEKRRAQPKEVHASFFPSAEGDCELGNKKHGRSRVLGCRSETRYRGVALFLVGLVFDVFHHVADGLQFLGVLVGYFHRKFLFEGHH